MRFRRIIKRSGKNFGEFPGQFRGKVRGNFWDNFRDNLRRKIGNPSSKNNEKIPLFLPSKRTDKRKKNFSDRMSYTYKELFEMYFSDHPLTGSRINPWELLEECFSHLKCPCSPSCPHSITKKLICDENYCCLCGEEILQSSFGSYTLEKHYHTISIITINQHHVVCRKCYYDRVIFDPNSMESAIRSKKEHENGRDVTCEANMFIQIGKYYLPGMILV